MNFKIIAAFLVLNFGALAIGGLFTGPGVSSNWYASLNKAPWTPPGWVFGAAWTLIMVCFAFYMTSAYLVAENKMALIFLFAFQWLMNVLWNPVFFKFHMTLTALVIISLLTILVAYFLVRYSIPLGWKSTLILPYLVWLCIATSLNAYIYIKN